MENKIDVLTKKLYDEGIGKAQLEADEIIARAKEEAGKVMADAEAKALEIQEKGKQEIVAMKKKAESEMTLSARQSLTALKQAVTDLIVGRVAESVAKSGFEDKVFVQNLLVSIVKKWDVSSGNINLEILLSDSEKKDFETFIAQKYKELLDKGLEIKAGGLEKAFVIQPKDGSYQIAFSEELFEAFFNQYMRSFTKALLYA